MAKTSNEHIFAISVLTAKANELDKRIYRLRHINSPQEHITHYEDLLHKIINAIEILRNV